jgi:raffinose/stachyose/melibiose transport system permease protein
MTTTIKKHAGPTRASRLSRFRVTPMHLVAYALLLALTAIYLGPLLIMVNTSFMTSREFMRDATSIPESLQFENFSEAWEKANFSQYMMNSAIYAGAATLIYVVTAIFVAFPIARRYIRGSNTLFTLFVIALFLPPALIPQFQLILKLGLYNTRMGYILLLITNPVGIIILVNSMKALPHELDEAAAIDGCGYFRFVLTIIFPLARPAIATVVILHAIGIWNELILATIYLTDQDFYPITRGMIVFQGVYGFNWPVLAAGIMMMALPMVILFLFLQRYIISGLTQGSIKG